MPYPTPDPSASLLPFQAYQAAYLGWAGDVVQLGYVVVVTGLALLAFAAGVVVVSTLRGR